MKRTFLTKLHTNGIYYLIGACLLLFVAPLYQLLVLNPSGYAEALAAADKVSFATYVAWIGSHLVQFLGYRAVLVVAFAVLLSLPFTLFRIIVAQEILGGEEEDTTEHENTGDDKEDNAMPTDAWRGQGFAVLAAWSGLLSMFFYVLGTLASSVYLAAIGSTFFPQTASAATMGSIAHILSIISNTAGGGLLALSSLFFGAIIARSGRKLWPGVWVAFGYTALAVAALQSASAVAVATTPQESQAILTTPAILLFAAWVLWFGIMLVRLQPESEP